MVLEFRAAPPRGRLRIQGRLRLLAQLQAARPEQARARHQEVMLLLRHKLRLVRKVHRRRAVQRRVQLRVGPTPLLLQALGARKGLLRPQGKEAREAGQRKVLRRVAEAIPNRAPKMSDLSPRDLASAKATLAHVNRIPTLNDLALINPKQAKKPQEHVIARIQANAKAVVHPSNLNNNSKLEF